MDLGSSGDHAVAAAPVARLLLRELRTSQATYRRRYDEAMAPKNAFVEHLQKVPLFSGCTTRELSRIAKSGDALKMTAGTLIAEQGQTGREAFVVLDGTVTVKRNGRKVATLGTGTIVGELSLLDHGPRTATVVCETDCEVFVISQRHFLAVIDEIPALGHKLLSSLAGRIRELDRQYYG